MKYEFHVGDYVETKTGTIGYVSKAPKEGLSYWTPIKLSYNDTREELYSVGDSYCIPFPLFPVHNDFNRIGQYDFTEKNKNKIEFIDGVDTADPNDSPYIIDKINELIEAVNRLEEKVNEMAQS